MTMAVDKLRIRFRKRGDLRFLSHHDLMRAFERMFRRAELPFRSTSGFHPKPRIVFSLSLPLGVVGLDESVEIELNEEFPPEKILERMQAQAPSGLEFVSARRIPPNATGQVVRAEYRLPVPPDRVADLAARCSVLLAQDVLPVQRTHPQPKRVDIRPYVLGARATEDSLLLDLSVTPTGSARADELIELLGLSDLVDTGAVLERIKLELHDELAVSDQLSALSGQSSAPAECRS
jgi:radical SAM-linked protein